MRPPSAFIQLAVETRAPSLREARINVLILLLHPLRTREFPKEERLTIAVNPRGLNSALRSQDRTYRLAIEMAIAPRARQGASPVCYGRRYLHRLAPPAPHLSPPPRTSGRDVPAMRQLRRSLEYVPISGRRGC